MINEKLRDLADARFATLDEARARLSKYGVEVPHLEIENPGRINIESAYHDRVRFNGVTLFCDLSSASMLETYSSLDDLVSKVKWARVATVFLGRKRFGYDLSFFGDRTCLMLGNQVIADLNVA